MIEATVDWRKVCRAATLWGVGEFAKKLTAAKKLFTFGTRLLRLNSTQLNSIVLDARFERKKWPKYPLRHLGIFRLQTFIDIGKKPN